MRTATEDTTRARDLLPLWFGILGPPVFWAARISTSYVLVPYACWWEWPALLHLVTLAALAATALAAAVAWRSWRRAGRGTEIDVGESTVSRTRFMARFGMLSGGLFFVVIVAEGLANFFVDPCQVGGAPGF